MTCFDLCRDCGAPVGELAHWVHDDGCDPVSRSLGEMCRCVGAWVCVGCCPEPECTPLAALLAVAREDTRARAEAWEAAQEVAG